MAPSKKKPAHPDEHHPTDQPAKDGVNGFVLRDGKFECHEKRPSGNNCYSVMNNKAHNITSHLSSLHKIGGKYLKNEAKKILPNGEVDKIWPCQYKGTPFCGERSTNFHNLVAHMRQAHEMRGSFEQWEQDALLQMQEKEDAAGELAIKNFLRELEDESLPPPDRVDNTKRDRDDQDQGPPGFGGGQGVAV
ncbi:Uu.00g047120.m01.CDS01 [Anthostomella pinea]|uniref:Uu.00g047120.m01.CDS01 n=1 Tax=Anthostomella pinea TaxID=933095 RepID=A0AAI8VBH0_9PEZI|nr:Uu.00g047120.m01.CDS01 [Anthostomella pinea]